MNKWIKTGDQLPPDGAFVLGCVELHDDSVLIMRVKFNRKRGFGIHPLLRNAAHCLAYWMECPEPPEEYEKIDSPVDDKTGGER